MSRFSAAHPCSAEPARFHRIGTLAIVALLAACAGKAPQAPNAAAEADAWFEERLSRLRRENGWLSLVGLDWLEEGTSTFGHDNTNDIVVSVDTGVPTLGEFTRRGSIVGFRAADAAEITLDGVPTTEVEIDTASAEESSVIRHDRLGFFPIQRGERVGIRTFDTRSPLLASFTTIERFPFDLRWRTTGRLHNDPGSPSTIAVPNILGDTSQEASPGTLVFEIDGKRYRLSALEGSDAGDLFLVFGDTTNGDSTYSGGRFLYSSPPAADGSYEIDFNRAYNPPCVFTPFATCPLPPPGNRLEPAVTGGEKMWGAHH